jgi:hypothetical protein
MSGPIGPPLTNEAHWRKFVRQLRLHGFDESIIEQLEAFRAAATGTIVTLGINDPAEVYAKAAATRQQAVAGRQRELDAGATAEALALLEQLEYVAVEFGGEEGRAATISAVKRALKISWTAGWRAATDRPETKP